MDEINERAAEHAAMKERRAAASSPATTPASTLFDLEEPSLRQAVGTDRPVHPSLGRRAVSGGASFAGEVSEHETVRSRIRALGAELRADADAELVGERRRKGAERSRRRLDHVDADQRAQQRERRAGLTLVR